MPSIESILEVGSSLDLADMVLQHRRAAKLSQKMLADLASVSRTAVQTLESGKASIQLDTILKILMVLNLKLYCKSPLDATS